MPHGTPNLSTLPSTYTLNQQFYFSSLIIQILFFIVMLSVLLHAVFRACADMRDPDYAEKDYELIARQMREGDQVSELSNPIEEEAEETEENKRKQRKFAKIQRRILTNLPFFIVGVITINSFTSRAPEAVLLGIAMLMFVVFNLTWIPARWTKLLFLIPLLAAYIPFYAYEQKFGDYSIN